MVHLTHIPNPSSPDDATAWAVRAEARLWDAVLIEKMGEADLARTVADRISEWVAPEYFEVTRLVASDRPDPTRAEDVVGVGTLVLPMSDNLGLARLDVVVQADRRGEGIGRVLHSELDRLARENGRTLAETFTWEPAEAPAGVPVLESATGSGRLDATTREAVFLTRSGYRLNQVLRMSRLGLPVSHEALRRLEAASGDYECLTLFGPIPDDLLDAVAALHVRMSTDVPVGDIDYEPEMWDEARVRAEEHSLEAGDRERLQTFVRHIPTGDLVGYTQLVKDRTVPDVVFQWDTLVVGEHRGHGLGMLAKVTNHAAVWEYWPHAQRVITGNASENQHMLAINVTMGFEPYACSGHWTRELVG